MLFILKYILTFRLNVVQGKKLEHNLLITVYKSLILVLFVQAKRPQISHPSLLHLFLECHNFCINVVVFILMQCLLIASFFN